MNLSSKLVLKQMLIPSERYGIKAPYAMRPEGLTIHETDNNASAYNEIYYMGFNPSNFNNQVSFHFAVDEKEAVQGVPLDRNTWHAGDGGNGFGNRKTIAIEICRNYRTNDLTNYRAAKVNAEILTGWLMFIYGFGVNDLYRHYDHSGKNCPRVIQAENDWNGFKNRALGYKNMFSGQTNVPNPGPKPTGNIKVGDTVQYSGRVHADSNGNGAGANVSGTYKVTIRNTNPYGVHLDQLGWVKPEFVKIGGSTNPPVTPKPTLTFDQVVTNTRRGDYGNYPERMTKIQALGFDYNEVQAEVNRLEYGGTAQTTNLDAVAREVWLGNYGDGQDRVNRLTAAGYDAKAVQDRVNFLYYS